MGFFSDFFDNVLGIDPNPVYNYAALNPNATRWGQQQAEAAPATPEAAPPAPVATVAPAAPAAPATPAFDASPFRSQVDQGFSQFTPEFYANKYAEYFNPYKTGVDTQYNTAKDALTAGVARRGLADSQQGRGLFQQLDALRDQAINTGQGAAQGFQSSLTDQVNTAKNNLYGTIGEGADNASVGSRASTEAGRIAGTKAPASTLGDLFGGLVSPYSTAAGSGTGSLATNPEKQAFATGSNLNLANSSSSPAASTKVVGAKKKF
jgi:hypothetical protein